MHSVSVSRVVQAGRTRVFEAFSSAGALSQWFSPSPDISVDVEAFEFVPAGKFRLRYSMPDGTQPVVDGVYELIEPPHRIAFSWVWQAPYPHAGIPTRVSVRFAEKDAGTEITITHDRLPSEETGEHHAAGWNGILDRLERLLDDPDAQGSDMSGEARHA